MFSPISKTQKIFLTIFAFFIFLIMMRFFHYLSFPDVQIQFNRTSETIMFPNKPIFQTFTAQKDNLNQVDAMINDFRSWSLDTIVFELRDASCDRIITTDKLDIFSFNYTIFTPFNFSGFSDLNGTRNQQYCAAFTFIPSKYSSPNMKNFPVMLNLTEKSSSFTNTGANDGAGETRKGRMILMKPAYGSRHTFENIRTLNDRISQYKPWFLKHYFLYLIAFGFLILSFSLIVILILI
jgi:hypothetical protein